MFMNINDFYKLLPQRYDYALDLGGKTSRTDNGLIQNANFFISQPNPMVSHLFESSRRDDSNEWLHNRVWLRNSEAIVRNVLIMCC